MSTATLTKAFAVRAYRLNRGSRARWARVAGRGVSCDECAGRQLEEGTAAPCRKWAAWKRSVPVDGPALFLCPEHAQLWRERDDDDAVAGAR